MSRPIEPLGTCDLCGKHYYYPGEIFACDCGDRWICWVCPGTAYLEDCDYCDYEPDREPSHPANCICPDHSPEPYKEQ